jgi:thiosulfate/3-mercaptopyruvate sulfurtransferase
MKTFIRTEVALPLGAALVFLVTSFVTGLIAQQPTPSPNGAAINPPWTSSQVLHAEDLSRSVSDKKAGQPQIFQVGFETMFKTQHVPGSVYAGPGRTDAGLEILKKAVAGVPKDRMIVLYCGCCPWDHCPNMKPAFNLLHSLGYMQVKVVEIPSSFGVDWVDKGYPVEGSAAH